MKAQSIWYTVSKTEETVGAGIYWHRPRIQIPASLSKDATMFQAQVIAVHHCTRGLNRQNRTNYNIAIFYLVALKAINSPQVKLKLVWDYVCTLNETKDTPAFIGQESTCGMPKICINLT